MKPFSRPDKPASPAASGLLTKSGNGRGKSVEPNISNPAKTTTGTKGTPTPMPAPKSAALQSTQAKTIPAGPEKNNPSLPEEGSPKSIQAKATPIALPGKTATPSQTTRTGSAKNPRGPGGSSSSSSTHSARRDSHTDHPVTTPHQDERGSGGSGSGSHGHGEGSHPDDAESMHDWLPPSGQLAPKNLRNRTEAKSSFAQESGLARQEHLAGTSKRRALQSALQSAVAKIASVLFKPSTVEELAKARRRKEREISRSAFHEAMEEKALKAAMEKQMHRAKNAHTEQVVRNPIALKTGTVLSGHHAESGAVRSGEADLEGSEKRPAGSPSRPDSASPRISQKLSMALAA